MSQATLPALREELNLFPGAPTFDGSPTWVLQDPAAHRFFRLGWQEFEILSRWHLSDSHEIVTAVNRDTTLRISNTEVDELAGFLAAHNLLRARGALAMAHLAQQAQKARRRDLIWLLKNYLFIRIPLLRPDALLDRLLPHLTWLGSHAFLFVMVCCTLAGLFLALRQWESFLNTFPHFFTLQGIAVMAVMLSVAKMLHEFGHALVARYYGCRVPTMGVALLVLWPVLYTDASDAWRLTSRRQRLMIGAAGMLTELCLAAVATLAWSFLPDGPLRSAVFLLATTTWIITLLVNLNPFMRFDGYYLLSDLLGIPNLQDRAFALARWRLRESLFGIEEPEPEHFHPKTRTILLGYAYGTWLYRFFLFLGIALLVYYFFFKVLGILLMVVELAWFIGRPLLAELSAWYELRSKMRLNRQTLRTLAIVSGLLGLFLFPWQQSVQAPALWRAQQHSRLYVPAASRLEAQLVREGTSVQAGQPLFRLQSPDLDYEIEQGQRRIAMLEWQTEFQSLDPELHERSRVLWQELEAEKSKQRSRSLEREGLVVRSPIPGVVREIAGPFATDQWLTKGEWLALVAAPDSGRIEAWVPEADLNRISEGDTGRFYPEDPHRPDFPVVLKSIDTASTRHLGEPYLASVHGGAVAVREDQQGRLIPESPIYRLAAEPLLTGAPAQIIRGNIYLEGDQESLALKLWYSVMAILIRESGF